MRVRASLPLSGAADVLDALEAHVRASARQLARARAAGRPLPALYRAGVRYMRSDAGERWQTPLETLARGGGDCEDLASWRAAELRLAGEPARVVVRRTGPRVLHALVRRASGRTEDPSLKLGMRAS